MTDHTYTLQNIFSLQIYANTYPSQWSVSVDRLLSTSRQHLKEKNSGNDHEWNNLQLSGLSASRHYWFALWFFFFSFRRWMLHCRYHTKENSDYSFFLILCESDTKTNSKTTQDFFLKSLYILKRWLMDPQQLCLWLQTTTNKPITGYLVLEKMKLMPHSKVTTGCNTQVVLAFL